MKLVQLTRRHSPFRHSPYKGTVIIELIIVTAMIGTTAIAILLSLFYGQKAADRGRHQARASQIASQEIEIIRSTDFDNLTIPYDGAFIGNPDAASELPSGVDNLVISNFDASHDIYQAKAKVSWQENSGTQSVEYTTLVVNNGL